jgi:acetyltransferase-like isoleucine patch superfamily enzyme
LAPVKGFFGKMAGTNPAILVLLITERTVRLLSQTWSTVWLKLKLLALGCTYGAHLLADGRVVLRVRRRGAIQLGSNVTIKSRFASNLVGLTGPSVLECILEGQILLGDHTGCSAVIISSRSKVTVGRNVNIGGNVRIFDHDYHCLDHLTRRHPQRDFEATATAPVVIGDDVFIGAQAIILKGVTVGDRAVIGAGAVVSLRHVPADAVVAGNPARVVKTLPSPGVKANPER